MIWKISTFDHLHFGFDIFCNFRVGHSGTLTVNRNPYPESVVAQSNSAFALPVVRDLLFGCYPEFDYPIERSFFFTGLIKNIKIHPDSVDHSVISSSQLANIGLDWEWAEDSWQEHPKPPIQRTMSFNKEGPDFVRRPPIPRKESLSLTFMFRTSAPSGLIAFLNQPVVRGFYLSLSMIDGCLRLSASPDLELDTRDLKLGSEEVQVLIAHVCMYTLPNLTKNDHMLHTGQGCAPSLSHLVFT